MAFLRILLIVGLIYFVYILLKRWLFPMAAQYASRKMQEKFQQQMGNFGAQAKQPEQRPEGQVNIDYKPSRSDKKNDSPDDGEYVDFEEIR